MKELHIHQKKLLELLRTHIESPLTMVELKEALDVSSTSVVFHHIQQLEKKGRLKRNPQNPKDYQILDDPENLIVYLNLYGTAQCGPSGTLMDGNPEDRIPIASRLLKFPASRAFMVKARGNSMLPKINPDDYVIAEKVSTAENGDLIVCVNDGEVMIKKYQFDGKLIILESLNSSEFRPFVAQLDTFKIEGIVRNVLSYG